MVAKTNIYAAQFYTSIVSCASNNQMCRALNMVERALLAYPHESKVFLSLAYDIFSSLPDQSRYGLYQHRFFDFNIKSTDSVLDIGSGHIPFPFATALADISLEDATVGRAGVPFKYVDGKPVYECSVESTPFGDKEFDFVYCSHVLEHVDNPEAACRELMRIGKRGYIETPKKFKDILFNTAKISNHKWSIDIINGVLTFVKYTEQELEGLQTSLFLEMNCTPKTREAKALAAVALLKAYQFDNMLLWDDTFEYAVIGENEKPPSVKLAEYKSDYEEEPLCECGLVMRWKFVQAQYGTFGASGRALRAMFKKLMGR